jgi:hypothetical protein
LGVNGAFGQGDAEMIFMYVCRHKRAASKPGKPVKPQGKAAKGKKPTIPEGSEEEKKKLDKLDDFEHLFEKTAERSKRPLFRILAELKRAAQEKIEERALKAMHQRSTTVPVTSAVEHLKHIKHENTR